MKHLFLFLCALVPLSMPSYAAKNMAPVCPSTLTEAPPVAPPNTAWVGFIYPGEGAPQLESIMFFDGHPREMASLAPNQETSSPKEDASVWRFQQTDPQRGVWIGCTYTNSKAMLTMRLPLRVRECRLKRTHQRVKAAAEVRSLYCE